jgi:hypothetical protein
MTLLRHFRCPSCGANLSSTSRDREYCGAVLSSPPGPSQASPDSRPVDQPKEMSKEERFQLGRRLVVVGWILAAIFFLAILGTGVSTRGVVCIGVSSVVIVFGKSLEMDNAPWIEGTQSPFAQISHKAVKEASMRQSQGQPCISSISRRLRGIRLIKIYDWTLHQG